MKVIYSLLIILALSGCYTKKKAIEKFCKADTTIVFNTDTTSKHTRDTLYFKGDSVVIHDTVKVNCVNGKAVFKPLKRTEKKGQILSNLNIDSNGAITVDCLADSLMRVIDSLSTVITNETKTNITTHADLTFWEMLKAYRWYLVVAFLIGLILGLWLQFK